MPSDLPAHRRTLIGCRQRLGFLPTLWFWNDRERQRLVLPLMVLVAVVVTPPLFLLAVHLNLSMWWLLLLATLWPQVVLGLVERRVRVELQRRARDGSAPHFPEATPPDARPGDRVPVFLAGASAMMTVLAIAAAWGAAAAGIVALSLTLFVVSARHTSQRLRRLHPPTVEAPQLPTSCPVGMNRRAPQFPLEKDSPEHTR